VNGLGEERHRRCDEDVGQGGELVGHGGGEIAPAPQHRGRVFGRVEHRAGEHQWADRVEAILQRGHHPEVAATSAQCPEQLGVLLPAGGDELAVGGHHVRREQAVAGQAALAQQPADPAAEGEASDASAGYQAAGDGQAERLGLVVER
jgi:hypothetical protein